MSTRDRDTYELTVVFERSLSDDQEVCAATKRTVSEQLAAELQEACNNGMISGSFLVGEPT